MVLTLFIDDTNTLTEHIFSKTGGVGINSSYKPFY